jgi:capsule biosynthesis phosphatase
MINKERCVVIDVDGALCPIRTAHQTYSELNPIPEIVALLRQYKSQGFHIILYSARNMNTFDGSIGQITAKTGKQMIEWLDRHEIPYDEIHLGKPWQGKGGFYVDDKTIRPDEFLKLSYPEILKLIGENPDKDQE